MKKYSGFIKLTALVLMVIISCSGCGLLGMMGSLNNVNGTVQPTTPPANDVIYVDPNVNEYVTNAAVIVNPDNNTTTTATISNTATTQAVDQSSSNKTTAPATTVAPTETAAINTFEDGDYLANIQDVLFKEKDENKARQILVTAGFDYDPIQDVYYTQLDSWQRNFGFNSVYDTAAPFVGMVYSTTKIYFTYDNKDWMMEIWKGQYGITAGAEIGFYNKPSDRVMEHYDCVTDEEMLTMAFDFYNMDELVFTRGPEKHWWLTGFKFLHVGIPSFIDLDMTIEFPNRKMANAFESGLKEAKKKSITDPISYTRKGDTFNIKW
jgi:hypothetical protein